MMNIEALTPCILYTRHGENLQKLRNGICTLSLSNRNTNRFEWFRLKVLFLNRFMNWTLNNAHITLFRACSTTGCNAWMILFDKLVMDYTYLGSIWCVQEVNLNMTKKTNVLLTENNLCLSKKAKKSYLSWIFLIYKTCPNLGGLYLLLKS